MHQTFINALPTTDKHDELTVLITEITKELDFDWEKSLTVYDSNTHVTQLNKIDISRGFVNERPLTALEMVRESQLDAIISFAQGMGLRNVQWINKKNNLHLNAPENWVNIAQSLTLLSEQGRAIFLAEPSLWSSQRGKNFIKELEKKDFYINALFELPPNSIELTSLRPYLYYFSRHKSKKLFIAELNADSNVKQIIHCFKSAVSNSSLLDGIFTDPKTFNNFQSYRVLAEFTTLTKHYKNFTKIALKDLVIKTKIKDFFVDQNSIYLRMAGNFKSVDFGEITKNKYVQLILDPSKINPIYLHHFLNTDIGQKFLGSFSSGSIIPYLSLDDLLNAELYLLPLDLQQKTVQILSDTQSTIHKLQEFQNLVIYEPAKAVQVTKNLRDLTTTLTPLSEEEKLLSRIRQGENAHTEFKSTLRWDLHQKKINKDREHDVLRTVCGFMNTSGGLLFVGVEDDGNIIGTSLEAFPNKDKLLLHFKSLIKDQIGASHYPLIKYDIVKLLDHDVLVVEIQKSQSPVYLGRDQLFYVRTNPSTDELKGRDLVEYIHKHFDQHE